MSLTEFGQNASKHGAPPVAGPFCLVRELVGEEPVSVSVGSLPDKEVGGPTQDQHHEQRHSEKSCFGVQGVDPSADDRNHRPRYA